LSFSHFVISKKCFYADNIGEDEPWIYLALTVNDHFKKTPVLHTAQCNTLILAPATSSYRHRSEFMAMALEGKKIGRIDWCATLRCKRWMFIALQSTMFATSIKRAERYPYLRRSRPYKAIQPS